MVGAREQEERKKETETCGGDCGVDRKRPAVVFGPERFQQEEKNKSREERGRTEGGWREERGRTEGGVKTV